MGMEITFEGHGIWGSGGGAIPEDGCYHGVIKPGSVEWRGPRNNPTGGNKKIHFTVVHDSGYEMFDNVNVPGGKKGNEMAFCRFLLAVGLIEATEANIEMINNGGLKGQKMSLDSILAALPGREVWFDFKKPRGEGDYKQTQYLYGDEPSQVQTGTKVIADGRGPYQAAPAGATPAAAGSVLSLPTATPAAAPVTPVAPVVAQPAGTGAVANLLNL